MDGSSKVYYLDLQTLLTYLSGQSCRLVAELHLDGKKAKGYIFLQDGEITDCLLDFFNGQQLRGKAAYDRLKTCSQWQVHLGLSREEIKPSSFVPPPSAPGATMQPGAIGTTRPILHPKQRKALQSSMLHSLSAKERLVTYTVFTLINGKRSTEEIKAQLHLSHDEMDAALRCLYSFGLIE